ncbi:hypothetical protein HHL14_10550 [Paraburkholderia sp. G-4-1-8]|uniref:DUF2917 domain-containing protein n=1 Tax=Paraburkholderia antibiotica TaxID=2728839 RepID=A0A7X9X4I9_9BURK|nr:hypothetical protein [Paraburkholderia antibiotica]
MLDLRAGTAIVAVEGKLKLGFRDHALAWLGGDAPVTSITVCEGEQFVVRQHGVVSVRASDASAAIQLAPALSGQAHVSGFVQRFMQRLGDFVARQMRRAS